MRFFINTQGTAKAAVARKNNDNETAYRLIHREKHTQWLRF